MELFKAKLLSITELKAETAKGPLRAEVHAQIASLLERFTSSQKPYLDVELADDAGSFRLKVWNDHAAFGIIKALGGEKAFVKIIGDFKTGDFGLETSRWEYERLNESQAKQLIEGTGEQRAKIDGCFAGIVDLVGGMPCKLLQPLCLLFLEQYKDKFKRAAAARGNHHARRGGLVEHTAQIMRCASRICDAYPHLNRSLLLAGALFHDCGKLVENQYEENGFAMPYSARAELFGHIAIGVELVRHLAGALAAAKPEEWTDEKKHVIQCLCHLVLSHHGQLEWGSPVEPKMPEAVVLHYCDQIDAKLEMMAMGYANQKEVGPMVYDRSYPLRIHQVASPKEIA